MLKKLGLIGLVASCFIATQVVCAAINVNTATAAALSDIKGLGPAKAGAIIKERTAHGPYKNAADLAGRVKGLGVKSIAKLQKEGLTIGTATATSSTKPASSTLAPAAVRERR